MTCQPEKTNAASSRWKKWSQGITGNALRFHSGLEPEIIGPALNLRTNAGAFPGAE